ncbi:pentapeptide repeat-containing protein [Frigoribacterium sp. PhB24]|uniref:pentapeptide repeat-containing protein n=1 Tax=Frigoribacterium sp. PhB24 TaxID=2485204 RepID=UPI000F495383|nr:pentapeptide repeat-containing protein [Frigoribacterium sp. PhB24]ROS49000.1 pentapeptide repeat protein [Frigoribacterium sp. PhB24]
MRQRGQSNFRKRGSKVGLWVLGAGVYVVLGALALLFGPRWIVENFDQTAASKIDAAAMTVAVSAARQALLLALGGVVGLAGVLVTIQRLLVEVGSDERASREHELRIDENRTSRYASGVEQLAHPETDVQLGGVYALERLARDSRDDLPVIEQVLMATMRRRATERREAKGRNEEGQYTPSWLTEVEEAILQVSLRLGLTGCDISFANLAERDFSGKSLPKAVFSGSVLDRANLSNAWMPGALFSGASLSQANLTGGRFDGASLANAHIMETKLDNASFRGSTISFLTFYPPEVAYSDDTGPDFSFSKWIDEPGPPDHLEELAGTTAHDVDMPMAILHETPSRRRDRDK